MKSCEDCIHCGVIVDPGFDLDGNELSLQKYCPDEYLFNHPNAEECKNFGQKDASQFSAE